MEIQTLGDLILTTERLFKPKNITNETGWLKDILSRSAIEENGDELWVVDGAGVGEDLLYMPVKQGYYVYFYTAEGNKYTYKHFTDKTAAFNYFRQHRRVDREINGNLLIDTSRGIIASKNGSPKAIQHQREIMFKQQELYIDWVKRQYPIGTKIRVTKSYNMEIPNGTIGVITRHIYPHVINIAYEASGKGLKGELEPVIDKFDKVGTEAVATIDFFPWKIHPSYLVVTIDQQYANQAENLMERGYQDWMKKTIEQNPSPLSFEEYIISSLKEAGFNFSYSYGGRYE